jgi:hypothetical protein
MYILWFQSSLYCSSQQLLLGRIDSPPGTGKTLVGIVLTQILLASTNDTILCVCYTNHALDDFLEGLLDVGIHDIVRLGGRSKNERLAEFNLRELAKAGKAPFTRDQTRRYAQLKGTIEEAGKEVDAIQKKLRREIGKGWWSTVEPYLQYAHQEEWKQLWIESLTDSDGFKVAGVESEDHLWKLWVSGKQACAPFQDRNKLSLWSLSKHERALKKLEWQHELYEDQRVALAGSLKTIKNAKDELKMLQDSKDSIILSKTRIIACTTTKAAMCKHLLDDVSAGVVLVEEAAEIFESHVLTSLSKNTKRLIMIGDHKQLRPKAQHYPLTVESNRQYDLNRSLFERLAQQLPTSRLGIQHRMHPSISEIPRLTTYPELKDAPGTADRPMVKGLQSRLIFINHNHSEDFHKTEIERVDAVSKTNQHEVDMIVAIVRYLFQQGYQPGNLVVLTPYLGQLLKIQRALSSAWNVFIDDMDYNEARSLLQGVEGFEVTKKGPVESSVRVATIDNYQGEEADIVIASLVRGNSDHNIGFLREPERVNVLLSRARLCEIVVGNRETLEGARGSSNPLRGGQLWTRILCHLDESDSVFDGLPVVCQSHSKEAVLRTPDEISEYSPDGGCPERCAKVLECGHPCTKRCHVGQCSKCLVACPDKCPRGHTVVRLCSEANPPDCKHVISWKCPFGHALSGLCHRGKDSSNCTGCRLLQEKEEEQLQAERSLQEALDKKHHKLEQSRELLQEALRQNLHQQQMSMIEEEQALVQRQLEETQEKNLLISPTQDERAVTSNPVSTSCESERATFLADLDETVHSLLCQSESRTLPATEIADSYKKRHGRDLQLDANRLIGNADGSQMRYQAIFEHVSCCEIVKPGNSRKQKRRKKGVMVRLSGKKPQSKAEYLSCEVNPSFRPATVDRTEKNPDNSKPSSIEASRLKTARIEDFIETDAKKAHIDNQVSFAEANAEDEVGEPLDDTSLAVDNDHRMVIEQQERDSLEEEEARLKRKSLGTRDESCAEHQQSADAFDTTDAVSEVVGRFKDEGALSADNLLDEIKNETSFRPSSEFLSLEYIIAQELDPCGNISRPPSKSDTGTKLCEAVCLYSFSLYCSSHEFPLQAMQHARKVLTLVNESELQFPKDWLERVEKLVETEVSSDTLVQRSKKEDTPEEKWSLVLTGNHNAPAVMKDSVLPMIGLKSVKNSMIGMYHRIKLAQEQHDGVAASYNIRFEGNPGTGYVT